MMVVAPGVARKRRDYRQIRLGASGAAGHSREPGVDVASEDPAFVRLPLD